MGDEDKSTISNIGKPKKLPAKRKGSQTAFGKVTPFEDSSGQTTQKSSVTDVLKSKLFPAKKPDPRKGRPLLPVDYMIHAITTQYRVLSLLGSGGFGDVYEVEQMSTGNKYALKTEDSNIDRRLSRLKVEALLLELCTSAKSREHFLTLIEKGKVGNYKFIIMPIVDKSLDKVRKDILSGNQFSRYTAWNIAIQLMESLRDLHALFFLHRDLKPQNFAIGKGEQVNKTVYMLDFGVSRKYTDNDGKLLVPRCKVKFMGTLRYAPRAAHRGLDQSRKDDLESLCIVIADIYHEFGLTWRGKTDPPELIRLKDGFMRNTGMEIQTVYEMDLLPPMIKQLTAKINDMNPMALEVDYEGLIETIRSDKPPEAPLDWLNKDLIAKLAKERAEKMAKAASRLQQLPKAKG